MQWMFMLIGLVLGWALDESFSDAGFGALLGLGVGQAIRLSNLGSTVKALEQRLALLEKPPQVEPSMAEPAPAPELVWELPAELQSTLLTSRANRCRTTCGNRPPLPAKLNPKSPIAPT